VPATTLSMTLPGEMLQRGFWLYVWKVATPKGEMLYVGRTGDNSSPNASAPYARMGQHLGFVKASSSLRARLAARGIAAEDCGTFELVAHGPVYPEVDKAAGLDRASLMAKHTPIRNLVGAMEKALADELLEAGYTVINKVNWRHQHDTAVWRVVREAFCSHFPKLHKLQDTPLRF
jgi:hypothetical protein